MTFAQLEDRSNPEQGLFIFEQDGYPGPMGHKASGMGFLVHSAGLVATAAHVLVDMGLIPGMKVTLYAGTVGVPIALEAEILFEDQWRGPKWQTWFSEKGCTTDTSTLTIPDFIPPEEYFEDTAVLRLQLETARAARKEQKLAPDEGMRLLKQNCRVLPLASPGLTNGARLKAWHAFWDGSDLHQIRAADAGYRCAEPGLQHSIRLHDDLGHLEGGYSGSPLWDGERRRVVGMVRRGIKTSVQDAVLGVDARRIAAAARVALLPDPVALGVIAALRGAAEQLAPMRHFPILQALLPNRLLDLRVRPALPRDPLADTEAPSGAPGIAELRSALAHERVILVAGSGGSGKTTLLVALAQDLLAHPLEIDGQRLVPLYLQAADFHRTGFDLDGVLRDHVLRHTPAAASGQVLRQVLRDNDLSLVLMIDGLDELSPIERAKLTGRFRRGAELAGSRAILTARPTEELIIKGARSVEDWLVLEVAALDRQEVGTLTTLLFEDAGEATKFTKMLAEIRWDRQGPTPLQIVAAASLSKSTIRWQRGIDLPFLLADHLLWLGIEEDAKHRKRARTRADAEYYKNITEILEYLAQLSLNSTPDEEQVVQSVGSVEADWASDPEGLLRFLKSERTLLGGLIAWLPGIDAEVLSLRWPHRTLAEALAARAVAKRVEGHPPAGVKAVQDVLRKSGQSSAMLMLAAMDASPNAAVEISLLQALERGSANFKLTLFAIRALGAGIRTSPELRKRLVATLITLLLLPEDVRLGPVTCAEVFSVDDLPQPVDIAQRPDIRAAIVDQLHERFSRRVASLRRNGEESPVVRITAREAQMLDRLAMRSDITLPYVRIGQPDAGQAASETARRMPRAVSEGPNGAILDAGLLSFAIGQLQEDANGFLTGFVSFVNQLGPKADLTQAGRMYVGELLKRYGGK
ncbi:MAG: NACHT domain-containing protein [Hyphomicrobiales bacterium]|jgi:energy-coupling factor transporter ATP-binding protein EcfA2